LSIAAGAIACGPRSFGAGRFPGEVIDELLTAVLVLALQGDRPRTADGVRMEVLSGAASPGGR